MSISFLLVLLLRISLSGAFYPKFKVVKDDETAEKWSIASKTFDNIAWSSKGILISTIDNYLTRETTTPVSASCLESLKFLKEGLMQRQLWSYQFLDAWSKGDISYSGGFVGDIGKYYPCIRIKVDRQRKKDSFVGKFCAINVNFPLPNNGTDKSDPMTILNLDVSKTNLTSTIYHYYADRIEFFTRESFSFGVCVPSACTDQDVDSVLKDLSKGTMLTVGVRNRCDSYNDRSKESIPIVSKICLTIVAFLIFFVLFSTLICFIFEVAKDTIFTHFDIRNSHYKLFNTQTNNESYKRMRPMDFFITTAQFCGSAGHALAAGVYIPSVFPIFYEFSTHVHDSYWLKQVIFYAAMGANCFFVISGFFCCYIVYPMMVKAGGKIPFHLFALKRWLRTLPCLIFIILATFVSDVFTTFPMTREAMEKFQKPCITGWWKTLLMINNFDSPTADVCVLQTWFSSADFQLWLLSYIPLVLLVKHPKAGILTCLLFMAIGSMSTAVIAYLFDLPSFLTGREYELLVFFLHSKKFVPWFLTTNNGMFSYFFGFLTAYLCIENKKLKSPFSFKWIGINLLLGYFAVSIILTPLIWTQWLQWPTFRWFEILYATVNRMPFGFLYAIVLMNIYHGFHKYIPFMGKMLKWKIWVVTSRLAFSVFLCHVLVMVIVSSTILDGHFPSTTFGILTFLLIFEIASFLFAYLLYVFVEAPFASILSKVTRNRIRPQAEELEIRPKSGNSDKKSNLDHLNNNTQEPVT